MIVKLIVLILELGSTGVGVLSVRQSRLVASNEMTQSRLRSRELSQRSMELRAQIAERITPDEIRAMLGDEFEDSMTNETQHRIDLLDPADLEPVVEDSDVEQESVEKESSEPGFWTLDDGTRVYFVHDED